MPTSISTPISDITFKVLWVSGRMISTPTNPMGMASMIRNGSMNDLNCAVRIRKSKTNEIRKPSAKLLNEASMPCTMPRRFTRTLPGIFVFGKNVAHSAGDASQIFRRGGDVDIDGTLNLIVVHFGRRQDLSSRSQHC